MKTLNDILTLAAFMTGILAPNGAFADKMNADTQDLVIKKMERVLSAMEKTSSAYLPSQQRLADLLSERARMRFMLEVEANCNGCKGSQADRLKAVSIYESLLKDVKINEHGPILFQLAHLYEMAGQNDKAITLYESIIKDAKKKNINPAIVTRSRVGLGDLLFSKGSFKEARENYLVALKDSKLENRSLTVYNLAWCEFNTDNLKAAIATLENLLKSPQKITRDTDEGSRYDGAFHTDIMRDLATFYTKQDVSAKEINMFDSLAPSEKRKDLLLYFAKETDRIGQKKAAREIMSRYLADSTLTKEERIDASVHMAQISYDQGETAASIAAFAKAAADIQKNGCKNGKCDEFQKSMKRFVTELHRSKKLKPDQDLLNAYVTYTNTFPADKEMVLRGASVATEMNNFAVAIQFNRIISENRAFDQKDRTEALQNEVSVAERSKNPTMQREAYLHYLKYADEGPKAFEVRYQLAYLSYSQKQYKDAADAFEDLAKDKKGTPELRKKAADLSLDALAQLKDEKALEALAWDYSVIFPQHAKEYSQIARRTLMNSVARTANDTKADRSDLKSSLNALDDSKIQNATPAEKILFYKNQSVLALKVEDEKTYITSLNALLAIPALSKEDRLQTLEQLTGYYEKRLDFQNAYATASRINNPKISDKEKEFRLGTLADLGGMDASKHYRRALKAGLSGERAYVIRTRLVLLSSSPVKELKEQAKVLKQKPSMLNETVLLVYGKTGDAKGLSAITGMKEMRKQTAVNFIAKQSFYEKVGREAAKMAQHKLNTKNDRVLQKSLTDRILLLKRADKLLEESLALKDVTAQMLALNVVSVENLRMVQDLAGLPLPAGLSEKEKAQYLGLLKNQSRPYLMKARVAQAKEQEIWTRSNALAMTIKDYQTARPELKPLLGRELSLLNQVPGKGPMKSALEDALSERPFSSRDLVSARKAVAQSPSDLKEIENLKMIETKIGHPLMPAYLEARISHLQRGKSL